MSRLFNEILNTDKNTDSGQTVDHDSSLKQTSTNLDSTDLKYIYKELKLLRKFQFDLSTKFNKILNKLDPEHPEAQQQTNKPSATDLNNIGEIKKLKNLNLTGAKKRKFINYNHMRQEDEECDQEDELDVDEDELVLINDRSPIRSASVMSSSSSTYASTSTNNTSNLKQVKSGLTTPLRL